MYIYLTNNGNQFFLFLLLVDEVPEIHWSGVLWLSWLIHSEGVLCPPCFAHSSTVLCPVALKTVLAASLTTIAFWILSDIGFSFPIRENSQKVFWNADDSFVWTQNCVCFAKKQENSSGNQKTGGRGGDFGLVEVRLCWWGTPPWCFFLHQIQLGVQVFPYVWNCPTNSRSISKKFLILWIGSSV